MDRAELPVHRNSTRQQRTGAREYVRERARAYSEEALSQLESVGVVDSQAMERLRLIVVSVISA